MVSGGSHWPGRRNRRHNLPDGSVGWLQPARAAVLFGEHNLKAPQATRWHVARVSTPLLAHGLGLILVRRATALPAEPSGCARRKGLLPEQVATIRPFRRAGCGAGSYDPANDCHPKPCCFRLMDDL